MVNNNNTELSKNRLSNLNTNFENSFNRLKENTLFLIKCILNSNLSEKDKIKKIVEYAVTYSTDRKELINKFIRIAR